MTRAELAALRRKYERLVRLRLAQAAGSTHAPRAELRALAQQYPGCLRELDAFPMHMLEARLLAVMAAEETPTRIERWMRAVHLFHGHMRGLLWAKKWLAGRQPGASIVALFHEEAPADARAWADELERVHAPPHGRLSRLAVERVALTIGLGEAETRAELFGSTKP